MPPKIKIGLKKDKPEELPAKKTTPTKVKSPGITTSRQLSKQLLLDYLRQAFQERFTIEVEPKSWVLPNRAKFPTWLDVTFKYADLYKGRKTVELPEPAIQAACEECSADDGKCVAKIDSLRLFPHQQFIVDYMQFASPYRGVLLLHFLGSGKSCSATAAAEVLANNMNVVVMTPASLRGNFIEEIKKCGRYFYAVKQNWMLISVAEDNISEIVTLTHISSDIIRKQKGIWVPVGNKTVGGAAKEFTKLSEDAKTQIKAQIDSVIDNRTRFINYNGLNKNKIKELTKDGTINPFDNSCVVIDEIHNLIGRVVNKRQIGRAVYKLLMQARNVKLILLSGTPIINQPHEIAYIVNLLTGPRKLYELKINKNERFDMTNIKKAFDASKYVDRYMIDSSTRKIAFELLPNGFEFSGRPNIVRSKGNTGLTEDAIVDQVVENIGLPKARLSSREGITLPDDPDEFNRLFINADAGVVTNQDIFARRVMGTVSYYKSFSEELYPSVKVEEIQCPLTDYQFGVYEKARQEERRKESRARRNKAGGAGGDGGQVYRFYSRANCNFVFPESIKRPFPTSAAIMKGEVDMAEEGREEDDVEKDLVAEEEAGSAGEAAGAKLKSKRDISREYHEKLNAALSQLESQAGEFLTETKLAKLYSPKMAAILKRLAASPGKTLVYSQFRTVEGLGILGMALKHIGWAELKLKKTGKGEIVIDGDIESLTKRPLYTMFTGNNDESKLLLKLYNGDLETLPDTLRRVADKLDMRVIMITQSGAEGISLKNVRQVHVMEPYWNQIRIDQVIGRAVRTCSHVGLPRDQRNVTVYLYRSVFTDAQLKGSFTIRTQDNSETSDQYIHSIAQRKAAVINKLLEILQSSAIDCALNAKYHKHIDNLRCFSFPINMKSDSLTYEFDIARDKLSVAATSGAIIQKEWEGQVLVTKKGQFLVRPQTNEVYDYDLYLESGRLVRLGTISEDGKTRRIRFDKS